MPIRPRSHVLPDIAEAKLRLAVQPEWLVRVKDKDYGIDFEVEHLTDDGNETGFMFYVQSKATNEVAHERIVQMNVESLKYLTSFEVPAMIVRYSAESDKMYWIWATEASAKARPGAKTVTLTFDDKHAWNEKTLDEIKRTLPAFRILKRSHMMTTFPFRISEMVQTNKIMTSHQIIDRLSRKFDFIRDDDRSVPITLNMTNKELQLSIERIVSASAQLVTQDVATLEKVSLYLLASILHEVDQHIPAAKVARYCLAENLESPDDTLAAKSASALIDDGDYQKAVDLALLNGLHTHQEDGNALFRLALLGGNIRKGGANKETDRFYSASIDFHESREEPIGMIRYSYANYLLSIGDPVRAMHFYNSARRDYPQYWELDYFLKELGGLFFLNKRYRASARAYECALKVESSENTIFRTADAELYAGNFIRAQELFSLVSDEETVTSAEARLKIGLADWALESGVNTISDWDVLFQLRESAEIGSELKYWTHIGISFLLKDNVDCWADSIFLSSIFESRDPVRDVMQVAALETGLEAFQKFKMERAQFLAEFDYLYTELEYLAIKAMDLIANKIG